MSIFRRANSLLKSSFRLSASCASCSKSSCLSSHTRPSYIRKGSRNSGVGNRERALPFPSPRLTGDHFPPHTRPPPSLHSRKDGRRCFPDGRAQRHLRRREGHREGEEGFRARLRSRREAVRAALAAPADVSADTVMDCVNTVRFLAIDAINKSNSGLPCLPHGRAPWGTSSTARRRRAQPQEPLLVQPRPRALRGPRLHAPVLPHAPHRLPLPCRYVHDLNPASHLERRVDARDGRVPDRVATGPIAPLFYPYSGKRRCASSRKKAQPGLSRRDGAGVRRRRRDAERDATRRRGAIRSPSRGSRAFARTRRLARRARRALQWRAIRREISTLRPRKPA